jgi:hypothetical protein
MTPQEMLAYTEKMAAQLKEAQRKAVFVGLPAEKVGGKVYGGGMTVLAVGAIHEYGAGSNPQRSFLRSPFSIKRKELNAVIAKQYETVTQGVKVSTALGLIGVAATQVSKGAFTSRGYGTWPDIEQQTKNRKGSSQVLIDKGILRSSITWVIRDAA